ncbi:hypothetical protein M1555_05125 [Patescibacteria group bacterium]|nr:hypothetical protein [Patescibacteria group bacterium]
MAIPRQIIGSFEDIGKDVVKQAASVPKDIVGKALESLGSGGGKKTQGQGNLPQAGQGEKAHAPETPVDRVMAEKDIRAKRAIARSALEYLSGAHNPPEKKLSVWEQLQKEKQEKLMQTEKQEVREKKQTLPKMSFARKRGDLYGLRAKKASAEMSRNVRQD